ncbi:MAG: hypothetical protein FD176_1411 [Rhodospirillaceae bacterium]|nr:MAG: hypothetical protein FD176_1411 [Rhodospirillaceae bacterium]TNC95902.1 MAG: Uncharacterized protein FD119_1993 [Stygiobacter sp.]
MILRILPYLLVLAMAAPVLAWVLVNALMIKGQATSFSTADLWVLVPLGLCMLAAFGLLATWMEKAIIRTRG